MNETTAKEMPPSLRSLYSELSEIDGMLENIENRLDYTVNGSGNDKGDKTGNNEVTSVNMEMMQNKISSIRRKTSNGTTLLGKLLGN